MNNKAPVWRGLWRDPETGKLVSLVIEIDLNAALDRLAPRALKNKSGKTALGSGSIVIRKEVR